MVLVPALQEAIMEKSRLKKTEATSITTSDTVKTPKPKLSKKPAPLPYPEDTSKHNRMIALLTRDDGATIDELIGATIWQKHSIRGAISGALKKRMGLAVTSVLEERGRIYRISGDSK